MTEKARTHGEEFIKAQYPDYNETKDKILTVKPTFEKSKFEVKPPPKIVPLSELTNERLHVDFTVVKKNPKVRANKYPENRHSEPRVKRVTIERQLKLLSFLREQSNPVKIKECDAALGFRCTYIMSRQRDHDTLLSLEELGLAERTRKQGSFILWHATPQAVNGETLIKAQYPYYDHTDTKTIIVNTTTKKRLAAFRSTPKTLKRDPVAKGILLLDLLRKQTEPIGTPALEKALKFRLHKKLKDFEKLGLIVAIPISKCSFMWELTPRGRRHGEALIKEHYTKRKTRTVRRKV